MTRTVLLCGDPQQPSQYIREGVSELSDCDVEIITMDWHADLDAAAFRDITMNMESRGPNDYDVRDLTANIDGVAVLVVHKAPVARAVFAAGEDLEIVAAARGGIENIDTDAAADHDVTVLHAPGRNANAVSDYAVAFGLAAHRNIPYFTRTTKEGKWALEFDPEGLPRDVANLTVGIVGFGNIGRKVAERYAGFGSTTIAHDPYVDHSVVREHGTDPVAFETLLETADLITLHVRLSEETVDMIDAAALNRMKESALLVNTARGGLIDEDALVESLQREAISGGALDVFEEEPLPDDHPFRDLDNVLLSPHTAGSTYDAVQNGAKIVARDITAILNGRDPEHRVQ